MSLMSVRHDMTRQDMKLKFFLKDVIYSTNLNGHFFGAGMAKGHQP